MSNKIKCDCTDEIVCPYCGYEFTDSWWLNDCDSAECEECGKEFKLYVECSVTYSTEKKEEKDE